MKTSKTSFLTAATSSESPRMNSVLNSPEALREASSFAPSPSVPPSILTGPSGRALQFGSSGTHMPPTSARALSPILSWVQLLLLGTFLGTMSSLFFESLSSSQPVSENMADLGHEPWRTLQGQRTVFLKIFIGV